ncbi:MAG: hypothetical protein MUC42_09345 [Bryobacter sp.]|jgi:hypothetical protein|nr:hypothetical protein [Bryobacter sp.]
MRGVLFLLTVWLAGCAATPPAFAPPASLDGGWTLKEAVTLAAEAIDAHYKQFGAKAAHRLRYEGPATVEVTVYEASSNTGAFELMQNWRPREKHSAAYKGRFFYEVSSTRGEQAVLNEFLKSFEKKL